MKNLILLMADRKGRLKKIRPRIDFEMSQLQISRCFKPNGTAFIETQNVLSIKTTYLPSCACLHVFTVVKDEQQWVCSWSQEKIMIYIFKTISLNNSLRASNQYFWFVLCPVQNDLDCHRCSSSSTLAPRSLLSKKKF